MKTLVLAFLLLSAVPVLAQVGPDTAVRDALKWKDHGAIADWTSTAMVGVAVLAPCWESRHRECFIREGINVGIAVGLAEVTKRLIHRGRPNAHDTLSFFSEHTELACLLTVGGRAWALCPAVGYLRMAADWHWSTDVAAGAAVGITINAWRH